MMLILRIRKADVALADGRLDDAYQQAICEDVREHRRGQRLITRLTKAYQKRGLEHLAAGNAQGALADAERATRLGGNQPKLVALRNDALAKLASHQMQQRQRQQKIEAARQCIVSGDFSLGTALCEPLAETENTVAGLMQDADLARRTLDATLHRCRQAIDGQDWEQALAALAQAKRLRPGHTTTNDLISQVTQTVTKQVRAFLGQGRLDQAEAMLARLKQHAAENLDVEELSRMVTNCRQAHVATRSAEMGPAIENLKSLKQVLPEAKWLDAAIRDVETAARSIESLRTGPLGLLAGATNPLHSTIVRARQGNSPMPTPMPITTTPEDFLIHVDGAGSFLVVRNRLATVGTQSRSRPVNIPILGQLGLPRLTVERTDEDYFLSADQPVEINGNKTVSTLLADQDEIRLGRRGAVKFSRPCAASTSALLEFRGVRPAHGNSRRVVLMDDALVLGPQPAAHIRVSPLERAMVLHLRDGVLRIRPMSRNGETPGIPIEMNRAHDVNGLSLVVTEVGGVV